MNIRNTLLGSSILRAAHTDDGSAIDYGSMSRATLMAEAAAKLSAAPGFKDQVDDLQTAKEHVNNKALYLIHAELVAVMPSELIAALPDPGKDRSQSNNPAIIEKPNPKGGKPITVDFYDDLAEQLAFAKPFVERIKGLADTKAEKAGTPKEFSGWSRNDLDAELNLMRTKMSNIRKATRDAVLFEKQWHAVSGMPLVGIKLLKDKSNPERVRNTPRPIHVYPKDDPTEGRLITAATFMRYDVQKAMKAAEFPGSFGALIATGARGKRDDDGSNAVEVGSAEDYSNVLSDVNTWAGNSGSKGKLLTMLASDEGDDLLLNLYSVWQLADDLLGKKSKRTNGKTYMTIAEEKMGMLDTDTATDTKAA